jgi:transposase-like protein
MEGDAMNLVDLAQHFSADDKAREFLEKQRWPEGPICPHCGLVGQAYRLQPTNKGKTHVRPGTWKCAGCRKEFTVTVGTIFEGSHIPLHKWLLGYHLICASKKGMSAHQLHRMLGITYKSAWFMAHRIRYTMKQEPLSSKLKGVIEADETFIGGKMRGKGCYAARQRKTPVAALVERNGRARSFHLENISGKDFKRIVRQHIEQGAALMTDDSGLYDGIRDHFGSHETVKHSLGEYVRRKRGKIIHTNTVEGFFSILKRGVIGTFHHVSKQHPGVSESPDKRPRPAVRSSPL